jgi:SAM-dependent methyltransferase
MARNYPDPGRLEPEHTLDGMSDMALKDLKEVWEGWAREDPLWAILSVPGKTDRRWNPEEFFSTGRDEIRDVMATLTAKGIQVKTGRCLDFGCGVGRLTQGLAEFFSTCDGVDISPTMIREARKWNKFPDRCNYHNNDRPDLSIFADESFDFIYSNIVLQHIEPDISQGYIREFVRLLSDGGVAVFQVPASYTEPQAAPLPDPAHTAGLELSTPLPLLVAGASAPVSVRVRNDSQLAWPALPTLKLGNHWRSADGSKMVVLDDGRTTLPQRIEPGGEATIDLLVAAPTAPGSYILELDMVEEGICWFADRGSPTFRARVHVPRSAKTLRGRVAAVRNQRKGPTAPAGPVEQKDQRVPPRPYDMYGLAKARVMAAVESSGGRFLDIEDYNPAGEGWTSYRYFVTRTGAGTGTEA